MELSPYLKHFPLIFRVGTSLDIVTSRLQPLTLWYTLSCWSAVILSNTLTMDTSGPDLPIRPVYESLTFFCTAAHLPFLLIHRKDLSSLVLFLRQPFHQFQVSPLRPAILQEYVTWVNQSGSTYIFYHVLFLSCFMMAITPLFTLPFYPSSTAVQDLPLPVGRIPFSTDSYIVYAIAYVVSASAISTAGMFHASWDLAIIFACLKIKASLRLLSDSLTVLDERARHCYLHQRAQDDHPWTHPNHFLQACLNESIENHLQIIKFARLVNKCFSMTLLVLFQSAMVIIAILVFQGVDRENHNTRELWTGFFLAFACLVVLGIFNYIGQTIINESEDLYRVIYSCDWVNKPQPWKTSFRIMMTVSSRPLQLTVAGLYPLSCESYGSIMKAMYSYVNILLSLQKDDRTLLQKY